MRAAKVERALEVEARRYEDARYAVAHLASPESITARADRLGLVAGTGTLRYAQTMTFTTLVLSQLYNVLNARSADASAFDGLFKKK